MTNEIQFLINLENHILQNVQNCYKHQKANLLEQVRNGFIKFFLTQTNTNDVKKSKQNCSSIVHKENFVIQIKISGIWETDDEYGVTYKITSL